MDITPIKADANLALHSVTPKAWRKIFVRISDNGSQSVDGKFCRTRNGSLK